MSFKQYLIFAIFTISYSCKAWEISSSHEEDNQCAEIFLQPSFLGQSFLVKNYEQFSDLSDLLHRHRRRQDGNENVQEDLQKVNQTETETEWSFKVKRDCTLKFSSTPYMKGEVAEFSGEEEAISIAPKSVACECLKFCECEAIKLRKSECGRAYLNDDCFNCNSLFTNLKKGYGDWIDFPGKWQSEVKAIVLRKGCKVSIRTKEYGMVTYDSKEKRVLIGEDVDELGNIADYSCTCPHEDDFEEEEKAPDVGHDAKNYPQLLDIPRTKGGINTLLFSDELRRHPGLLASLQSLRSRRSSKNAYILLLGLTGSGKSSAVNLLFDHPNITKVGDFVSTTTEILQFSIPVPVPQLGMNNTALHVIDTPGIGDTRGYSQDAQFLATLEEFLDKHEDLKRRTPNVVLIFSKFSDNRFRGEGSRFVKMLRTIDLFKDRIIDKRSTNVIFVLSHYMSETKEITKDPRERIQAIREVIEEFSTLPRPIHIVLAENKPEESLLPNLNGFWKLPNGEYYPKNLFDQMRRNLVDNQDPVGEAIIRTAFSNSDNFKISGKKQALLKPSNSKVIKYLGVLASYTKPVTRTEVSTYLNEAYGKVDNDVKSMYPDVLTTLQRTLYMKHIHGLTDLPRTSIEIMKLLEEIQLNPLTLHLIEQTFNITIPEFKRDFVVGSGYSLLQDRTLPAKIFDFGMTMNEPSDILFRIPNAYHVGVSHQLDNQFQVFTDMNSFISGRMKSLGLSEDVVLKKSYSAGVQDHPGYNLIYLKDNDGGNDVNWNSLTASVNYHTFYIVLTGNAKFSAEFSQSLERLTPLNLTNEENVQIWRNFFNIYGTHVVVKALGGGSIQVKVEVDNEQQQTSLSNNEKFALLTDTMSNIVQQLANELIGKNSAYEAPTGVKYEFRQVGGNHKNYWLNFSDSDEVKNIDEWKDSLRYEPMILKSRLHLVPINEVVKEIGGNVELSYMIEEAGAKLLNASLIYIPVNRVDQNWDNPETRDTLDGNMGGQGDYESMREFADMFKMISNENQKMQEKIFQLMRESQAKKDLEDQKYQERLLQLKQEAAEKEARMREEQKYQDEMDLRRQQLENERFLQQNALKIQLEKDRMEMEFRQSQMVEQIQAQSHQTMLQFIAAENERNAQIAMAQINSGKESWWEKALNKVSDVIGGMAQSAAQVLPIAAMAG